MMWCLGTGPSPWNAKLQVLCHYSVLPEIPVCINIHIHTSAWMHVYLKTDLLTIYWASILCKCSAPSISTNPAGMSLVHDCCLINTVPWFLHLHFTLLWARGSPWGGGTTPVSCDISFPACHATFQTGNREWKTHSIFPDPQAAIGQSLICFLLED